MIQPVRWLGIFRLLQKGLFSGGFLDVGVLLPAALCIHLQVHGAAEAALSAATAIARAGLAAGCPEPAELARRRPSMQMLPKLLERAYCLRATA